MSNPTSTVSSISKGSNEEEIEVPYKTLKRQQHQAQHIHNGKGI